MNILITGGCGYVGSELVNKLLSKGHLITVIDAQWFGNPLKKHKNLKNLKIDIRNIDKIDLKNIDAIYHLAGIANDPSVELNETLSWNINVLATRQLIEKAVKNKVKTPGISLSQIEKLLNTESNKWYDSSVNIANQLFVEAGRISKKTHNRIKPKGISLFYVRGDDDVMGSIDKLWKHTNNQVKKRNN